MIETKESNKQNLVTYFILPLLQLNKSSFGADNFINSYLDKEGYVVINTEKPVLVTNEVYNNKLYITDYERENKSIAYVFTIPEEYKSDIDLFNEGKYSELSAKAKIEIARTHSSDSIIVKMMNPQLADRQKIADELGVNVKYIMEIKSAPGESNYIKIK